MNKRKKIYLLRVFVNDEKKFGNPVGIILDEERKISTTDRQRIASKLGFSESVFINNVDTGNVSIFNPQREVDFAGHALAGTAYFITTVLKKPIKFLTCRAGRLSTWRADGLTWIRANLENTPPWIHEQLQDVASVEHLSSVSTASKQHIIAWAWVDQSKGIIRARTFAPDWGMPEDEANGSGSMQLAAKLQQKLEIHHGRGSVIYANPAQTGFAEVGGRVKEDPCQEIDG